MKKILSVILIFLSIMAASVIVYADSDYYIKVNRTTNCVTVYDKSDTPVKAMICSTGKTSEGNGTPTGTYKTSQKLRWHALFGNEYGQYVTRITGHILFHSVPYLSENPDKLNTADYNRLGEQDSMGCIRLTAADACWIYNNCPLETKVTIFDGSSEDDPLGKPKALKLGSSAPYPDWDPTDPDVNNPWKTFKPEISPDKFIRYIKINEFENTEKFKEFLLGTVTAYDTAKNPIEPIIETNADPNSYGIYSVVFKVTDAIGRSDSINTLVIILP